MSKSYWSYLFAVLFPVYPVLHFYAENRVMITPGAVVMVGVAVLLGTLVIGAVVSLLTKEAAASFAAVSAAVFLLLVNAHVRRMLTEVGIPFSMTSRFVVQIPLHLVIGIVTVAVWFVVRRHTNVLKLMGVFSVILLLFPSWDIVRFHLQAEKYAPGTAVAAADSAIAPSADNPNIILLLLDGYARADVLHDLYGMDNTPFIQQLRDRGFFVADSSASNYAQTQLTLHALLGMQPIDPDDFPDHDADAVRGVLAQEYPDLPVWTMFKSAKYMLAATAMYGSPKVKQADLTINEELTRDIATDLYLEETSWVCIRKILRQFGADPTGRRISSLNSDIDDALNFAVRAGRHPRPLFFLGHILAPHPPFTLAADSSVSTQHVDIRDGSHYRDANGVSSAGYADSYSAEISALNRHIINTVDAIISSERPLTLMIMSDHGPGAYLDWESMENSDMRERMANFFAVYSSHGDVSAYSHHVTPVNVFPVLLNSHFGLNLPLHENRSWFSCWDSPLEFQDVTEELWGESYH